MRGKQSSRRMGYPRGQSPDFACVKAVSFPGISAKTRQILSKSQAHGPEHESPALLLETFPDTFDASLFSRHVLTRGHLHLEETRAFLHMK